MTESPLTVLVAPDSFKGTFTSVEVADALAEGWLRARPADRIVRAPLADGGEGTLAAIAETGDWEWRSARVADPVGRTIEARWLASPDRFRAVVEMAEASGLSRLTVAERDPLGATTIGTGELIRSALDAGARDVVLGIGGSATTDGGAGLLTALGVCGADLARDDIELDLAGLDARLGETRLAVACDVTNPLLGPTGAAATYGPQKGADAAEVATLDEQLGRWAAALERASGRHERETPGAGAAGGVGFALLCVADRFASFALRPGVELVMEAARFDDKVQAAGLVLTGEGRVDGQTAFGKTAAGVARRAATHGVRCIVVGGTVTSEGADVVAALGAEGVAVHDPSTPLEAAIAAGRDALVQCAERLALATL